MSQLRPLFFPLGLFLAGLTSSPVLHAQTASAALDAAWVSACASATPGSDFYQRCQEILNAGPGSGDRRSAAASGNNLELLAAQGRRLMGIAKARAKAGARRAAEAEEVSSDQFWLMANESDSTLAQGSRWSLFGSFSRVDGNQSDTPFVRGSEDSGELALLGLDYRINDRWSALVAGQRDSRDSRYLRNSGSQDSDTQLWLLGLNYAHPDGFSAGLSASHGNSDSEVLRRIDYTLVLDAGTPTQRTVRITSSSDSEVSASLRGADLSAGWDFARGACSFHVGGDVSWQHTAIDRIIEDNTRGLDFLIRAQTVTSLQAGLETQASRTISAAHSVWQPFVRLRWQHEFRDDPRRIDAAFRGGDNVFRLSFMSDEPDRNFGELGLGVSAVFGHGWQAYASWQRLLGHEFLDEDRIDLGWRKEF